VEFFAGNPTFRSKQKFGLKPKIVGEKPKFSSNILVENRNFGEFDKN